jgi:hypothetical protein
MEGIKNQLDEQQYASRSSLNESGATGDHEVLPHERKRPEKAFFES